LSFTLIGSGFRSSCLLWLFFGTLIGSLDWTVLSLDGLWVIFLLFILLLVKTYFWSCVKSLVFSLFQVFFEKLY
jgi:hypothetical protein